MTYSYANRMRSAGASRWHEQFRYVYDAAGNLLHRTNHALVQSFGVNLNQFTNQSRSGKLTVAGKVFQKTPQQCPHREGVVSHYRARQRAPGHLSRRSVMHPPWKDFRDSYGHPGRDMALYLGRKAAGLKLSELGQAAGDLDFGSVSAAIARFEGKLKRDKHLCKFLENAKTQLQNAEL